MSGSCNTWVFFENARKFQVAEWEGGEDLFESVVHFQSTVFSGRLSKICFHYSKNSSVWSCEVRMPVPNPSHDRGSFFFFALSLHVFFLLFPIPFSDMAVFKALRSSCLQIAIQICYYRLVHRLYKSKTIAMVPSLPPPPPMIRCNTTVAHVPVPSETITMRHQRRRQRRRRRRLREMAPATMPALKLATTTTISTTTTTTTIIINSTTISTTTTIPIRIITIVHIHMQTFIAPILFTIIATIRRIWAVCVRQLHLWILNQPRKHIRPNINLMIAYWPPNTMNHRRYHQRLAKIRHRQILV